ncbi:hypothetical protein ACHHYP_12907 [Achlya hypogyna]|uniref:Actin-like protein n=1 Tax=Achlya hypogyna TaxID=1202772 RepID=A0A1V9ZG79_ACHHY|nr:hypothetical protein ACHHYP_12907 [Achlya hypogyna]
MLFASRQSPGRPKKPEAEHIVAQQANSRIPVRRARPSTPATVDVDDPSDGPEAHCSPPSPSHAVDKSASAVDVETTAEAQILASLDTVTNELRGAAAVAIARTDVHAAQVRALEVLLAATTARLDRLREGVYDTVATCFLHELHLGRNALADCMTAATTSDDTALAWIRACLSQRLLNDPQYTPPAPVTADTVVLYMENPVLFHAGVLLDAEDNLAPPSVVLEAPAIASLVGARYQPAFLDRSAQLRRCFRTIFRRLSVASHAVKVVLAHPPCWTPRDRERVLQLLFQELRVPAVLAATTAEVLLRATGHRSGVVVDVGPYATTIVPIYDDCTVAHAVVRVPGGDDRLVEGTWHFLRVDGAFTSLPDEEAQFDFAQHLAATRSFVAYDADRERAMPTVECLVEWQGASLRLPSQRALFEGPELLFQPVGDDGVSLPEALLAVLDRCSPTVHLELLSAVVLHGHATRLPGFKRRLARELVLRRHDLLGRLRFCEPATTGYASACTVGRFGDAWITQ